MLALAKERLLGEILATFLQGQHGALFPVRALTIFAVGLIAQSLLVGNSRRDLLLRLCELRPHVDENLIEHLLGIFGPRDQIVDVRPQERAQSIEESHGGLASVCLPIGPQLAQMRRESEADALERGLEL